MPKPRKNKNKTIKPKLHIFCEGEKTEPIYLHGYLKKYHSSNQRFRLVSVEVTEKNTPVALVEEAIRLKRHRDTPDHDIFWVVYDREDRHEYDDRHHQRALDLASNEDVTIALTNVCFEAWLLLHLVNSSAPYSSCKDLLDNSPLKSELKKLGINKYGKADQAIFDALSDNDKIVSARAKAERMNQATLAGSLQPVEKPHLLNPYTGMHYLLDDIDLFLA